MTDTPTRADLLPCPFCGGEAEYHNDKGPTGEMYGWVGCNQCDAMSVHTDTRSMQPEEQHPIDAWNTRAPTADAERIAALEDENAALKAIQADEGEMLTIAWMDGAHRSKQTYRERIAALEGEVERLREALEKIVALEDDFESNAAMTAHEWQMFHTARAALGESHE